MPSGFKPHYDLEAPDSLISPKQHQKLMERFDKFLRRAANPKLKGPEYDHDKRLTVIEALLGMRLNGIVTDVALRAVQIHKEKGNVNWPRVSQALDVLNGKTVEQRREFDPPPEPSAEDVDTFLESLSKKEDPDHKYWDDDAGAYVMCFSDLEHVGLGKHVRLYCQPRTPQPGDLIVVPSPCKEDSSYIGHFVGFNENYVKIVFGEGIKQVLGRHLPLVVTKVENRSDDDD
jgi:hypothetical protein